MISDAGKGLQFILFVVILLTGLEESLIYQLFRTEKEFNANGMNAVHVLIVSQLISIIKEQIYVKELEEHKLDYFHCFVNKGGRASADWPSKIQVNIR